MEPPIDNAPTLGEVVNENVKLRQRIEELEKQLEYLKENKSFENEIWFQKCKKLEEALAQYADEKNWDWEAIPPDDSEDIFKTIYYWREDLVKPWEIAQNALKEADA